MASTSEILAELEELGATGEEQAPPIRVVEDVSIESGSPSPRLLDERGEKMIELSDLVIEEFDNLIESAKSIRNAVAEMREMWRGEPLSEDEEDPREEDEEVEVEEPFSEDLTEEDAVESPSWGMGTPSPSGSISLSIPESVPLPPEVARMTDADLSNPPAPSSEEGTNE